MGTGEGSKTWYLFVPNVYINLNVRNANCTRADTCISCLSLSTSCVVSTLSPPSLPLSFSRSLLLFLTFFFSPTRIGKESSKRSRKIKKSREPLVNLFGKRQADHSKRTGFSMCFDLFHSILINIRQSTRAKGKTCNRKEYLKQLVNIRVQ